MRNPGPRRGQSGEPGTRVKIDCQLLLAGGLVLAALACARPPGEESGHTFIVAEEDGVLIARSSARPKYEGELFVYERLVVLAEDERVESMLVRGDPPAVDERGYFYVPDSSPSDFPAVSRICVYDSTGRFRYAFGRPGEGPGEFTHPRITHAGEGGLDIWDATHRRLSRFNARGGLLEVVTLPQGNGLFQPARCYRLPEGGFLVLENLVQLRRDNLPSDGDIMWTQRQATRYSNSWEPLASVVSDSVSVGQYHTQQVGEIMIGSTGDLPFVAHMQMIYHPDLGIVHTTGRVPVLTICNLQGRTVRRIEVDLPLQPVTAVDRDRYFAQLDREIAEASGWWKDVLKQRRDDIVFPDSKGYWGEEENGSLQIDDGGYLWIRIPAWAMDPGTAEEGAILYRVLSCEGEYLGMTRLPTDRRGRTGLTRGLLTAVEEDPETGAPRIVVWRIRPSVAGFTYP